jgi:hypothetical protein
MQTQPECKFQTLKFQTGNSKKSKVLDVMMSSTNLIKKRQSNPDALKKVTDLGCGEFLPHPPHLN